MGLCQIPEQLDLEQYKRAGFNSLLAWKTRPSILEQASKSDFPWFVHLYTKDKMEFTGAFPEKFRQLQEQYLGSAGCIVNDEPNLEQMEATGKALRWCRENYPNQLVMSNAFPIGAPPKKYLGQQQIANYGYDEHIRDFLRIICPDVLMVDVYPFGRGGSSGVSSGYYRTLEVIREEALRAQIPYWTFVQSYDDNNGRRLPSESDLRMQVFSSLTYGFTGIAYFTYDRTFERGLVKSSGEPDVLFDAAARVNEEIVRLGQSLRFLRSTDVQSISDSSDTASSSAGVKPWKRDEETDPKIRDISIVQPQDSGSGLIGFFRDDLGQHYFMLTNLYQHSDKNAEACQSEFVIKFHEDVKKVLRLNRETGKSESLVIDDPDEGLKITLPGGTGDLFKYDTGEFVGLP